MGNTRGQGGYVPERHCHILVVEDHPETLKLMLRLLKSQGYVVTGAATVAVARGFISALHFDLLIADLGLPDGSGYEVIADWKKRALGPAIAITGFGMPDEATRLRRAGFDVHFVKPVTFESVMKAVSKALAPSDCEPAKN